MTTDVHGRRGGRVGIAALAALAAFGAATAYLRRPGLPPVSWILVLRNRR